MTSTAPSTKRLESSTPSETAVRWPTTELLLRDGVDEPCSPTPPTEHQHQSGHLMCYEGRTSSRAIDIEPPLTKGWARMRGLDCGSQAVTERPERTAQGDRRFRGRSCGQQFNERSGPLPNRTQDPSDGIARVVLWRFTTHHFSRPSREVVGQRGAAGSCDTAYATSLSN